MSLVGTSPPFARTQAQRRAAPPQGQARHSAGFGGGRVVAGQFLTSPPRFLGPESSAKRAGPRLTFPPGRRSSTARYTNTGWRRGTIKLSIQPPPRLPKVRRDPLAVLVEGGLLQNYSGLCRHPPSPANKRSAGPRLTFPVGSRICSGWNTNTDWRLGTIKLRIQPPQRRPKVRRDPLAVWVKRGLVQDCSSAAL